MVTKNAIRYIAGAIVFALLFLSTVSVAMALEVPTSLEMGGSGQERNTEMVHTFTIKNVVAADLTALTITEDLNINDVTLENVPTSLAVGEEREITVKGKLPLGFDAVDSNLQETAFAIGTIKIFDNEVEQGSFPVTAQAANKLRVEDFDLGTADGDYEGISDGKRITVDPNQAVEYLIELRNRFNDGPNSAEDLGLADIDIDVEFDIEVDDDDDDDIIIGRRVRTGLVSEEREELILEGEIDRRAEGTYTLIALIEGTDDNGAEHGARFEFTLSIDRKAHDIVIDDLSTSKTVLRCERAFTVDVDYSNVGTKTEDQIKISVYNRKLDISEEKRDLILRDGDYGTVTFDVVAADDVTPGTYALEIKTHFYNKYVSDEEYILLDIQQCDKQPVKEPIEEPTQPEEPVEEPIEPEEPGADPVEEPTQPEEPREPLPTESEQNINTWLVTIMVMLILIIFLSLGIGFLIGRR